MIPRRVLLVIPRHGGSRAVGENIAYALAKSGHDTTVFDIGYYKSLFLNQVHDENRAFELVNQALVDRAVAIRAQLVLVMALSPIMDFAFRALKSAAIPLAHYFCEDLRAAEHWHPIIANYDHFFIIQQGQWLCECRAKNPFSHYLPNGAPVEYLDRENVPKEFDVAFAGAPYKNRITFFENLRRTDIDFRIFGWGWNKAAVSAELRSHIVEGTRWLSPDELFSIYQRARIVLNLHSTLDNAMIDPEGDFVNPRAFTVPLSRSLQFSDRRMALLDFFTDDKDIVTFASIDEFVNKARFYLSHHESARPIIANALDLVTKSHLLTHRVEALLAVVFGSQ